VKRSSFCFPEVICPPYFLAGLTAEIFRPPPCEYHSEHSPSPSFKNPERAFSLLFFSRTHVHCPLQFGAPRSGALMTFPTPRFRHLRHTASFLSLPSPIPQGRLPFLSFPSIQAPLRSLYNALLFPLFFPQEVRNCVLLFHSETCSQSAHDAILF